MSASISYGSFVSNYNSLNINITLLQNQDAAVFEQVLGLWEDVRRNGFTKEEFEQEQYIKGLNFIYKDMYASGINL